MYIKDSYVEYKRSIGKDTIKTYNKVDLKVNDMHLSCFKKNGGKWFVKVMHEGKDTHKDRWFTTDQLANFLRAYQITSRGKTLLRRF